jgi:hypothetical protein
MDDIKQDDLKHKLFESLGSLAGFKEKSKKLRLKYIRIMKKTISVTLDIF